MKKTLIFLVVIILSVVCTYIGITYYRSYVYYKSDEYSYIQHSLAKLTMKLLDTKVPFYEPDLEELLEFLQEEKSFQGILFELNEQKFLEKHLEKLYFKSIPDSNALILYHVGFDRKNNHLNGNVFYFENLSLLDFFLKPKGDAVVSYLLFHELCETPGGYLRTFYNSSISFMHSELDAVSIRLLTPAIKSMAEEFSDTIEKNVCLLYQFDYSESMNSWEGILLLNENNISENTITMVKKNP